MGEYRLRCVSDRSVQPAYSLACPHDNSLLRADYLAKQIEPKSLPGIWRFLDWLPVQGIIAEAEGAPVTYRSRGLARELGLENLYISFNGYWPERGAKMPTCSFKDLEAAPTMQRLLERGDNPTLVVASAGNTARAFAHVAFLTGQPLVLFVPEKALARMWTTVPAGAGTAQAQSTRHESCNSNSGAGRLLRCHSNSGKGAIPARLCGRGRSEKHRPPGRHGHSDARRCPESGTHARALFPGGGKRHGRHIRLGGSSSPQGRTAASAPSFPDCIWPRIFPMRPFTVPGREKSHRPHAAICSMTFSSTESLPTPSQAV